MKAPTLALAGLLAPLVAAPLEIERLALDPAPRPLDANIEPRYPIEKAAWVWHPEAGPDEQVALRFVNEFELSAPAELVFHLSADQRYELTLDGEPVSFGPDRGDVAHWSFASYRVALPAGSHRFEALVAWIGPHAPDAQHSHAPGFIFAAEGELAETLDSGRGGWQVARVEGWSFEASPLPWSVGSPQTIDGARLHGADPDWRQPKTVTGPMRASRHGVMRDGWRLRPTRLPEQRREPVQAGRPRALIEGDAPRRTPIEPEHVEAAEQAADWAALLVGEGSVTIPADRRLALLVDLEDYYCAFPQLRLGGGAGSRVGVAWTEALYETDDQGRATRHKGDRDEVLGKVFASRGFRGYDDFFLNDGGEGRDYRSWWWRAGRYLLIEVETADEPLVIERFSLLETRYPLEDEGRFQSSDPELDATHPLMVRGMQMCSHETYMDCPYYEQLMYTGDTRLEMLVTYLMTPDARLPQRGIELFDWSRGTWQWELPAGRYPSRKAQIIPGYSLIWISMLRDFAYWRDDPAFLRERLPGMRGVIEQFRQRLGPSGLLEELAGWPFTDWVPEWETGVAPDGREGISSINNLFLVQSLRHAAEVEEAHGDPLLALRNQRLADELSAEIVARFWVEERGLLADDEAHQHFSEHAQCLALLNGVLDEDRAAACFDALLKAEDLSRASIYFSHYLFETLKQHDRGDLIVEKMDFWKNLVRQGLKTPVEQPEPSRSDCHAWGSHPLFHGRASLFGLRPATPGFGEVEIAPSPGPLTRLEIRAPHPAGWIEGALEFDGETCRGSVTLPDGVTGTFHWQGNETDLKPGVNELP